MRHMHRARELCELLNLRLLFMQETDLSVCPLEVFRMLKRRRIGVFLILHDPVAVLLFYFPAVCAFRNAILRLCKNMLLQFIINCFNEIVSAI